MSITLTAFSNNRKIAEGTLKAVITKIKNTASKSEPIFIFNDKTGGRIEVNFDSDYTHILAMTVQTYPELNDSPEMKEAATIGRQRGRPKLGVVSKEITLLPRQWEWLATQPGGASATIRRLVDEAKKLRATEDSARQKVDAAYKFLNEIGGNLPNYEESLRALFAFEKARFKEMSLSWPKDISHYALKLAF